MNPAIHDALAREGPLPLARAMLLAVQEYYATREPFGRSGDFITAPEVSQMFGELLGLALADLWRRAGGPAPVLLVEFGPGRGTLMADALRAIARAMPDFRAALSLHFVEQSARLRAIQRETLAKAGATPHFHDDPATIPKDAPILAIGNEFLDALPLSQFERFRDGWVLRRVTANARMNRSVAANLAFIPEKLRLAEEGSIYERNFAAEQFIEHLARRLATQGGAALFLDYGYEGPALGDTLQAIRDGAFADPLTTLGEADLSAHVDFAALKNVASPHVATLGPVPQGLFLERLGLDARAEALKKGASIEQSAAIEAARVRLAAPAQMGGLFKALALHARGFPAPAGFSGEE